MLQIIYKPVTVILIKNRNNYKTMKKIILVLLAGMLLIACNQNKKKNSKTPLDKNIKNIDTIQKTKASLNIYGNYVSDEYQNRKEGYDWVAVSVKKNIDNTVSISIRSRVDRKRPTCTFDSKIYKKDDKTYESFITSAHRYDGKKIIYRFSKDSIRIFTENKEDEGALHYYCSGGSTIAGTYTKINEPLDSKQIDKTSFTKSLNLQGIGFSISSIRKNGRNTLSVFTSGL
ncbi:MAG: hypothetical protein ACWIPI_04635, partial [Polaribacter sp.]